MRKTDLAQLVEELRGQQVEKRDLVVPAHCLGAKDGLLTMRGASGNPELDAVLAGLGISTSEDKTWSLEGSRNAHAQLCEKLDIPRKYYDKMQETGHNRIYDQTLNYWFNNSPKNYFVRTFVKDGGVGLFRALLADNYKVIDHMDVLIAALDAVKESGVNLKIEYCDLTEEKMYIRFIAPDVEVLSPELVGRYRTPGGDRLDGGDNKIYSGFVLSNSEVGQGKFNISGRMIIGACNNGMIFTEDGYNRMHMGSRMEEYSFIRWSEETRRLDSELIISQVRDAVKTFISPEYLGKQVKRLEEQGAVKLEHPMEAVKNVCKFCEIPEERVNNVLNYFIQGADTRRFGVSQALTYYAQHDADADEQFKIEQQSVQILSRFKEFDRKEVVSFRK